MSDNSQNRENPLGSQPINRLLVRFAVPSIIAMLVSALYNIVDQFYIGRSVGILGNAATNVAFPLTITCTAVSLMCGIGGAANFNLSMGRGKRDEAVRYAGNAIMLLFSIGVLLCLTVRLFLRPMMVLFGATPDVLDYSLTYTGITSLGFPFLILTTGGSQPDPRGRKPAFFHAVHADGCGFEHDSGSAVHLHLPHGHGGRRTGYDHRPDHLRHHGDRLSVPL